MWEERSVGREGGGEHNREKKRGRGEEGEG